MLRELVGSCGWRLWTLRTSRPCVVWELRLEDLAKLSRLFPELQLLALAHVTVRGHACTQPHAAVLAPVVWGSQPPSQKATSTVALLQVAARPAILDGWHYSVREYALQCVYRWCLAGCTVHAGGGAACAAGPARVQRGVGGAAHAHRAPPPARRRQQQQARRPAPRGPCGLGPWPQRARWRDKEAESQRDRHWLPGRAGAGEQGRGGQCLPSLLASFLPLCSALVCNTSLCRVLWNGVGACSAAPARGLYPPPLHRCDEAMPTCRRAWPGPASGW